VMSSGPAISSTKRKTASDDADPSSATSTRLWSNMADLLRGASWPVRCRERRVARTDEEDRHPGPAQHHLGDAAEYQPAETAAAVAGHHDEIGVAIPRGLDDRLGWHAVPRRHLDVREAAPHDKLAHAV